MFKAILCISRWLILWACVGTVPNSLHLGTSSGIKRHQNLRSPCLRLWTARTPLPSISTLSSVLSSQYFPRDVSGKRDLRPQESWPEVHWDKDIFTKFYDFYTKSRPLACKFTVCLLSWALGIRQHHPGAQGLDSHQAHRCRPGSDFVTTHEEGLRLFITEEYAITRLKEYYGRSLEENNSARPKSARSRSSTPQARVTLVITSGR